MALTTTLHSPEDAVARIAYLSSDVVVSVQPSLVESSPYSGQFAQLAQANVKSALPDVSSPEIRVVRQNADPFLSVYEPARAGRIVSVTTTSDTLISAIPHLYKLLNYPVVIHVSMSPATFPDYSTITSIRNTGLILLQSESTQEAQDIALAAHALALKAGKAVVHFFSASEAMKVEVEDRALLDRALDRSAAKEIRTRIVDSDSMYADDGVVAQTKELADVPAPSGQSTDSLTPASIPMSNGTSTAGSSSDDKSTRPSLSSASSVDVEVTSRAVSSEDISKYLNKIFEVIKQVTTRSYDVIEYSGPKDAEFALFVFGSSANLFKGAVEKSSGKVGIITSRLYRPWFGSELATKYPKSVKKIAVLEQIHRQTTKWGPVFLDLLSCLRTGPSAAGAPSVVAHKLGYINKETVEQAVRGVVQNLQSENPVHNLSVGAVSAPKAEEEFKPEQPFLESAYMKILDQLFGKRLHIANSLDRPNAGISNTIAASPEFGYGSLLARIEKRQDFISKVEKLVKSKDFKSQESNECLSRWLLVEDDEIKSAEITEEVVKQLDSDESAAAKELVGDKSLFPKDSSWLIGSDAWAYDLGNSGVHHVVASGKNINMLIIDSQPYSEHAAKDAARRKKDIGLYAMNFGNAYVASIAVYSSYTQVLHAMLEADKFDGPSVVLAYLPYNKEDDSALTVLQETKKAVDLGYWPLYRYDPNGEEKGGQIFTLESERIKKELKDFLSRENHFSQMVKRNPSLSANVAGSYGSEVRHQQKRKAKDAYNKLLEGLSGPPLTILYASDGGNAENLAKRLGRRGKARTLKTLVMSMEDYPVEDLPNEENLVLLTSTAGQGEFPQNGRSFWEHLKGTADLDLANVNYSVFALGDSHYWPRKQDRIYYNKPGKDLDKRLADAGGKRMVDCGLGDDQDPDAYQTGYSEWEPKLWTAMGVANIGGIPDEPPPITNEDIKIASNFLRGTIEEGLADETTGAISAADQQLTKFHGTYMQDDRDIRDERKAQGLEPAYSFMIRCRLPGGVSTPKQWQQMDAISDEFGNHTMKLTTRQTFQFHGILKRNLKSSMRAINKALMTTIAACGDVNRNVMCSSIPSQSAFHASVQAVAQKVSDHLLPSTTAYHEIWLRDETDKDAKKVQVAGDAVVDHEPLYGPTYLPRKFKITIAVPPNNDTDVYAHDIGLIAIKDADGKLAGFNLLAGGGMGVTHNNKKTYPRTGSMFGFVETSKIHLACEKIMLVQRDHGDRKNRKHARLKYTIDDMGVPAFKAKVEELLGWSFQPERPFKFASNVDTFGWQKDESGLNHFTFFIENGRIEDTPEFQMKTGLLEIAKVLKGEFRLTGNQHLIVSNVKDEDLPEIKDLMAKYKLDNTAFSALRLSSSACVAFPTCGLAMAESERYLPVLISKLEGTLEESGLRHDSIVMRMTGCPNGCARPWLAEVAFVGKAYGAYNMYLGGGYHGQRLNKLFRSSIKEEEILDILKPMFKRYAVEREDGERFGDFCIRMGIIKETWEGKTFHEDTAELEEDEEE